MSWILPARRGLELACRPADPLRPARRPGQGGTLPLEVRLDALGRGDAGRFVLPAGRPGGRDLQDQVGDSLDLLHGEVGALALCQPNGTFVASLADLRGRLVEMALVGEAVCVDGLATRASDLLGRSNRATGG